MQQNKKPTFVLLRKTYQDVAIPELCMKKNSRSMNLGIAFQLHIGIPRTKHSPLEFLLEGFHNESVRTRCANANQC